MKRLTTSLNNEFVQRTRYYVREVMGAALAVAALYGTYVFAPVCQKRFRFEEAVQEMARKSAYNDEETGHIQDEILETARQIGVPLKEENVHVTREETFVRIEASYEMPVKLWSGREFKLNFSSSNQEKVLTHAAIQVKKVTEGK